VLFTLCLNVNAQKKAKLSAKEIGLQSISKASAEAYVSFLASDELEGRESGFHGSRIASQFIVSQLKLMGIKPLYDTYFQNYEIYCADKHLRKSYQSDPDSIAALKKTFHRKLSVRNVLGMIPGKNSNEYVIVGAHFDHVGIDPTLEGDQIYNGADDNASGASAVLQIARAFALSGVQPERNIIFAFWDSEERGLMGSGSHYFVQNCSFVNNIKGYLNFDMVGRDNKPEEPQYMVFFYTEAHPAFGEWLKSDIVKYRLDLHPNYRPWDKPVGGSDNSAFALKGIPILWYHTDYQPDMHRPTDHADKINYNKLTDITKAGFLNMWNLANIEKY
jgi:Zn-dependent M28 family amino/carboxypeptidase